AHDGLSSCELDLRIKTLCEGEITLAREAASEIGQPERLVHLGVSATRHVERQAFRRLLQDIDLKGAVLAPQVERPREALERLIYEHTSELGPPFAGELLNHAGDDLKGSLPTDLGRKRPHERPHDSRLDLALLQQRKPDCFLIHRYRLRSHPWDDGTCP